MTSQIDAKWKRFSVDTHFSSYNEELAAEFIFDMLNNCTSENEWDAMIDDMDVATWYPFEHMSWDDLRDSIESTARTAQQYAEAA